MSKEKTELYTLIYDLLLRSGSLSIDIIADVLRVDVDSVKKALENLITKKLVAKIDGRFVALPKIELLVGDIKELEEKIGLVERDIHATLDEITEKIVSSYSDISDIINEKIDTVVNSLEVAMTKMESEYKTMISQNISTLREFSDTINEAAKSLEEEVSTISESGEKISEGFKRHVGEAKRSLLSSSKEMFDSISQRIMVIRDKYIGDMEQSLNSIQKNITKISSELVSKISDLTTSIRDLTQKIDKSLTSIKNIFEDAFNTMTKIIDESKPVLEESIYKMIDSIVVREYNKISDLLSEHNNIILNILTDVISKELDLSRELKNNVATIINMIGKEYSEISDELSKKYTQLFEGIRNRVLMGINEAISNIITHIEGIKKIQMNSFNTLETILRNDLEKLRKNLLAKIDEILTHSTKELKERITSIENIGGAIKEKAKTLSETLDTRSKNIMGRANETISKFLDSVKSRLSLTRETINYGFVELEEKIKVEEVETQMKKALKGTLQRHMDTMKNLLVDIIRDVFNEIKNTITERIVLSKHASTDSGKEKRKETKKVAENRSEKKEKAPIFNEIHEQIDKIVVDRLTQIENLINKQLGIVEDNIVEVILNISKNVLNQNQQYTLAKVGDTKTLIANELSWVESEIRSRIALFLDKINTMLQNLCDYTKNWLSINMGEIEEKLRMRVGELGAIENVLRERISEVKSSYQDYIISTENKTINRISESKGTLESSVESHIKRVSDLLRATSETISTQMGDASKSFKDVVTKLDLRMKNLIDQHLVSILEELSKHHSNIENLVREASKSLETSINTVIEETKKTLFDMKENIFNNIINSVMTNVEKILASLEAKKNEVINGISESHEGIQSDIFDKVRYADQVSLSVSEGFKKLTDNIKTTTENIKTTTNIDFQALSNNMSESYNIFIRKIDEEIIKTSSKIEESTNKIFDKVTSDLDSLGQRLRENLASRFTENISILSDAFSGFESKFLEVLRTIKDPIKNASEETKKSITKKIEVMREKIEENKQNIDDKILEAKKAIKNIPDSVYNIIERYIENIRSRPKGIFMIYGLDILKSITKVMVMEAKESVVIVSHTLSEPIINAIKSAPKNVLVELYCETKIKSLPENVCITKRKEIPKEIIAILVDHKKLFLMFENADKQYIGTILEGLPVTPIIEGLTKYKGKR